MQGAVDEQGACMGGGGLTLGRGCMQVQEAVQGGGGIVHGCKELCIVGGLA